MSEDKNALKWYRNKKVSKTGLGFPRHSLHNFFSGRLQPKRGDEERVPDQSASKNKGWGGRRKRLLLHPCVPIMSAAAHGKGTKKVRLVCSLLRHNCLPFVREGRGGGWPAFF